jgi:hypothetical protein
MTRHAQERHLAGARGMDCFASLAMTARLTRFWSGLRRRRQSGEQATMNNRFLLAVTVLAVALIQARTGAKVAQDFLRAGLPWLGAYLAAGFVLQAHLM